MKSINHFRRLNTGKKAFTTINITPLTDIALTLLVVFMIATPMLMQSNINVNLPKVESKHNNSTKNSLVITINRYGSIYLDNKKFSIKDLKIFLKDYGVKNKDGFVIINGDKSVKYDMVVKVLDIVKNEGINKVSLGIEVEA
jgi:biopolymer transport protein ExbD